MVYFCQTKTSTMNKAERTRRFIIEQSAPIINKKGMSGTSLSDIMEATKLAKGGIYGNFTSKDEICMESFSYLSESLAHDLDRAVLNGKTAEDKLYKLLDVYDGNKINSGGCPLLNFGVEADDTHPQMKEMVRRAILASQKRILTIISDGIANKELSSEINPKHFSIKVFAMIEGAILCRRVLASNEQMKIVIEVIKADFKAYLT